MEMSQELIRSIMQDTKKLKSKLGDDLSSSASVRCCKENAIRGQSTPATSRSPHPEPAYWSQGAGVQTTFSLAAVETTFHNSPRVR